MSKEIWRCQFEEYKNKLWPGQDDVRYQFLFSATPDSKVGQPDEHSCRTNHRVIVDCSDSLMRQWSLGAHWGESEQDLQKILYWYAREALRKSFEEGMSETEIVVNLRTHNSPKQCPYDPIQIIFPNPEPFKIERKRRIGF
jgi:hypothetical protein